MPLKIAMIGAGSAGSHAGLMANLLTVPEFAKTTFAYTTQLAQCRANASKFFVLYISSANKIDRHNSIYGYLQTD